jgi:thiamine-phosphate pyrophosphorylase
MSDIENQIPQIYLITPSVIELGTFKDQLAGVLDSADVACVRMALASTDEGDITRAADQLRELCHAREIALVIESHFRLVEPHGLDGVHLPDSSRQVRDVRELLGSDAIVGTYCGCSRHAGMTSGEIGADYVSFGPIAQSALGDGSVAEYDLFEWWSETVEVPVVAEGNISLDTASTLAPVVDFFGLGDEIWGTNDPADTLKNYLKRIS